MQQSHIYLDQNVLDFLAKGRLHAVKDRLIREDVQLVYSSCNLEEIHRTTNEELRDSFLDCLDSFSAVHFWTDDNDQVHLSELTARESYLAHVQSEQAFGNPEEIIQGLLFKMFGGHSDDSFRTVFGTSEAGFDDLLESVLEYADEAGFNQSEHEFMISHVELLREKFKKASSELMGRFEKDHGSGVNYSMIDDARTFTGVGPTQLNNIEPPRVIAQIWDILSSSKNFPSEDLTFDTLFGENSALVQALPQPTKFNRVNGLYGLLNAIGYYSDPKLTRKNKFIASLGDHQHAGYGSFASEVLSRDRRFVRKAVAVYEHLGIPTVVTYIEPEPGTSS